MSMKVREIHEEEVAVIRVDRTFSIPPAVLWDWVTQSDLTSQWIGPWHYVDETDIEIIWNREKGSPAEPARILEVNEGCGYTLQLNGMPKPWLILVSISEPIAGSSQLTMIQPLDSEEQYTLIQAGWEYYADCLKAAVEGQPYPDFSTYWNTSDPEIQ